MYDTLKKKSVKRDGKSYRERNISGGRTGEEADGIVVKRKGREDENRDRKKRSRGGRMREVEREGVTS